MIESGGFILAEDIGGDWGTFNPTWMVAGATPTIGDGSLIGRRKKIGRVGVVTVRLVWGSTTSAGGAGAWSFGGFPADIDRALTNNMIPGYCLDLSPANLYTATALLNASGGTSVPRVSARTATGAIGTLSSGHPFTWSTGDVLFMQGVFQTAS